ncbi:hypoxanthine phosphoribosyltransferase [Bacteriovorax sp. BAL6_X]|uniref:hypoxanthine phosphoribosyltransferase n=1 Tax=Bacteriovorax sp. BAL6_X TaxID=1201290 RepID=UPI0003857C58|nr:hypoxanthine phosphoribosyltransferase [Bacteriovorax sp. BAL6_X]EPZ49833.1 hypoxanthine phosphoribosyltransferase [Bacteriovorax sp. BAL6_X]
MAIETYFSEEKINERIKELAAKIDSDFQGEEVVVIGVLNGAFIFVADLIRQMNSPVYFDFIGASSYKGTESTGKISITKDIKVDIKDKNVILVEDIVDTGLTISELTKMLKERGPKTIKLATLLHKKVKTQHNVEIDYLGFEIEDKFVIGYGLDFDGRYRELPYIGIYNG